MRKINITDLPRETKITLTIGDLHDFFEALIQQHEASKLKTIYDTKEACELLGVNRQTLAYYRNEGYLGYSRHGDKFWYSQKDIEDFFGILLPGSIPATVDWLFNFCFFIRFSGGLQYGFRCFCLQARG